MTTPTDDTSSTMMAAAENLLTSRVEAIRPVAAALAERNRIRALLHEAEKVYGAAYSAAQGAGWSTDELKQMGAEEPARRPQGRPRSSRTRRSTSKPSVPPQGGNDGSGFDGGAEEQSNTSTSAS
ncbi:hypothetical protein [Actinacidiphila sp. bgisy144]|uniref:hypothetical protein n=1 Tax=Actinacidiphila sp. bgisy144 TaxID=3413791 RepID=UPI003EB695F6